MKNLIYLLMIVFIVSCHNTKEIVKTETSVNAEAEINRSKKEESKTNTEVVSSFALQTHEAVKKVIKETVTELSKPDSLGNQYPEKITERTIESDENKQTATDESTKTDETTQAKSDQSEQEKTKQDIDNQTKSKEVVKQAVPVKLVVWLLVFAAIGFLLVKFRNRIFKF